MIRFSLNKELKAPGGELLLKVDCEIATGSFISLYGASGVGKTSLLRILAGLLSPDKGHIEVNGRIWLDTDEGIDLKPQQRKIGFVFQDYALFPNMTVRENRFYALPKVNETEIADELMEVIELTELQNRKPDTLSGGQKQRVALARALVGRPEILMLDEPLSALDYAMRQKLQDHILEVHRKFNLTTILISHEISEIFRLSDKIYVLENGKVTREGTPLEIFSGKEVSGKFKFTGEVISIEKEDVIYVVSVLIGNDTVKVVADVSEIEQFKVGDKVLVASKAFNPLIEKIH